MGRDAGSRRSSHLDYTRNVGMVVWRPARGFPPMALKSEPLVMPGCPALLSSPSKMAARVNDQVAERRFLLIG